MKNGITQVCALAVMGAFAAAASPLGTAFTYQGRLTDDGTPANGSYDFWFKLYDADSGGVQVGPTTVLNAQPVSNGLFTVALDFGGNAFTGGDRWLDIYVHNSTNDPWDGWAWLSPRQPLTAAPYALYASQAASAANAASAVTVANSGVTAQGLSTPLAAIPGQLLTYSGGSLVWTNPAPPAVSGWQLGGNSGTSPGVNYIGTSDDRSLEFRVGGSRALRIEWTGGCPHLIGGHPDNYQDGIDEGATIGGGGPNGVVGNFGTVAGGKLNEAGEYGAVAGGQRNAAGDSAAVGGGVGNWAPGVKATVAGGDSNQATGECAVVSGGAGNLAGAPKATVAGGQWNAATLDWATVGGGINNLASGVAAAVPGGNGNIAQGGMSLAAGTFAHALHDGSFVWGDATYQVIESTAPNQFIIQAAGGVGINTNAPATALHVAGTVTADAFSGRGAVKWHVVDGTSQLAAPNAGYAINNPAQVTVTLPASPAVGDVVRVSNIGDGGWKLGLQAGQSVNVMDKEGIAAMWTARVGTNAWESVTSSADGSKLVAVVNGGWIYRSADSGMHWSTCAWLDNWKCVASSADGTKLVAGVWNGGVYVSTDSGDTWASGGAGDGRWSVACSADGVKMFAADRGPDEWYGFIWTSSNSGSTFQQIPYSYGHWISLACSANGTKLVAATWDGLLCTSTNSGLTQTFSSMPSRYWRSIASSADGTRLVAAAYDDFLYTSSDSGSTWTQRGITGSWISVASSADGTKLAAVSPWGLVYTSTDAGVHWVPCESARVWSCVASSADGDKLVAVASSDCIYTGFMQHTAPGPTGYLSGTAAVELLYSGRDGVWWILSHEGTIEAH